MHYVKVLHFNNVILSFDSHFPSWFCKVALKTWETYIIFYPMALLEIFYLHNNLTSHITASGQARFCNQFSTTNEAQIACEYYESSLLFRLWFRNFEPTPNVSIDRHLQRYRLNLEKFGATTDFMSTNSY